MIGVLKGVCLIEQGLMSNIVQFVLVSFDLLNIENQMMLLVLLVYYVFGMFVLVIVIINGGYLVLILNLCLLINMKVVFKIFKLDIFLGVNMLFEKLFEEDWFQKYGDCLNIIILGVVVLYDYIVKSWMEMIGVNIIEGYGMIEVMMLIVVCDYLCCGVKGFVGQFLLGIDVCIFSNDVFIRVLGIVGEIVIVGLQIMIGYFGCEQEIVVFYYGEWFKIGDMGQFNQNGDLYIVDCCKDMVLVGGFNVFLNEVDEVLIVCLGVGEVVSVGICIEIKGEELWVFVVKSDELLSEVDVLVYCCDYFIGYKVLCKVYFIEELLKNLIGKILCCKLQDYCQVDILVMVSCG